MDKPCKACGKIFISYHANKKFCSDECRKKSWYIEVNASKVRINKIKKERKEKELLQKLKYKYDEKIELDELQMHGLLALKRLIKNDYKLTVEAKKAGNNYTFDGSWMEKIIKQYF